MDPSKRYIEETVVITTREEPGQFSRNESGRRSYPDSRHHNQSTPKRGAMTSTAMKRRAMTSPRKKPQPSIMQWFDRSCERELAKRQLGPFDQLDISSNLRGIDRPEMVEATASGIDITSMLRGEQNTELFEACDKLAKAQAMDIFKGAVKAAEMAAANAPPEYAEEAAAAGARGYQAELTSVLQERIPGVRPMEVIGYVGITRPKSPKKRKH